RDVALAARGLVDSAVDPDDGGEKILKLAFARVAPPDAQLLSGRRRIDLEPGAGRKLRDRIDVGHMQPMGAAIVRHPEGARVGEAAPADPIARLDQREAPPGCRNAAR